MMPIGIKLLRLGIKVLLIEPFKWSDCKARHPILKRNPDLRNKQVPIVRRNAKMISCVHCGACLRESRLDGHLKEKCPKTSGTRAWIGEWAAEQGPLEVPKIDGLKPLQGRAVQGGLPGLGKRR
jgi:hypothetical protein